MLKRDQVSHYQTLPFERLITPSALQNKLVSPQIFLPLFDGREHSSSTDACRERLRRVLLQKQVSGTTATSDYWSWLQTEAEQAHDFA